MNSLFKTVTCAIDTSDIVPFVQNQIETTQQIFIKNLEINMFIGVLDHEKTQKQRVVVDVTLDVAPNKNWQNDSIDDVVSYANIIDMINSISQEERHIELVETFANIIADQCLQQSSVRSADITVSKPDIIDQTSSVGVRVTKAKK